MTTWRKEFEGIGVDASTLTITPSDLDLDKEFDCGYGGVEGKPFTAWSDDTVYFPLCYDGAEWIGSAPRNPCEKALGHQGG